MHPVTRHFFAHLRPELPELTETLSYPLEIELYRFIAIESNYPEEYLVGSLIHMQNDTPLPSLSFLLISIIGSQQINNELMNDESNVFCYQLYCFQKTFGKA